MTMFSMKPKFDLKEFLAENGPRKRPASASKQKQPTRSATNPDADGKDHSASPDDGKK